MFTGLVQQRGQVATITRNDDHGLALEIAIELEPDCRLGDSVAVNGTCLTIVAMQERSQTFQVGPETVERTNLGSLSVGDWSTSKHRCVSGKRWAGTLSRATSTRPPSSSSRVRQGEWEFVEIEIPIEFLDLVVPKGSIAIDGVSLTVSKVHERSIEIMLIPHTMDVTTLGQRAVGDRVNLEFDLLAKHVKRILQVPTKAND